ncbi:hypothetical protein SADUNF_Sadunf16G0156600 [Salix dunnii]|uniref:B-like cyclin n=1 Tax=Salix dunnii TaxID=1413687 RepID=A0A835MQD6_9ROSI|nr:hypothetical protein SADUNF_Sadunf16G0156600 [Salix dunnii]
MGSRNLVVSYQQQPRGEMMVFEEAKQKTFVPAEGRNRRVLQDIGNLVNDRVSLHGKKPTTEVVDIAVARDATKAPAAATKAPAAEIKKANEKHRPEDVIVISSDETEKSKPVSIGAAFGKPEDTVVDIDAADVTNELAVVEYVDDMYEFYKLTEVDSRVHDYLQTQPDINGKMRSILVDWLIEVHRKFELMPETLYLTINIVDRFLAVKMVPRRELQLVGISSMLLACKYEEIWAPEVNDFVCISDNAYIREQVLAMEKAILGKLEWYLTVPTPYVFLVRYIKASIPSDKETESLVFFLSELGLMQYPVVVKYGPSKIAASAVYAARCTMDKSPFWTETLRHHTGYTEDMLRDCAKLLVQCHSAAAESKLKAVYKKFSSDDYGAVALLTPARSLI